MVMDNTVLATVDSNQKMLIWLDLEGVITKLPIFFVIFSYLEDLCQPEGWVLKERQIPTKHR